MKPTLMKVVELRVIGFKRKAYIQMTREQQAAENREKGKKRSIQNNRSIPGKGGGSSRRKK